MVDNTLERYIPSTSLTNTYCNNYVSNMDICCPLNDYGLSDSNSRYSVLYLYNANSVSIYKETQGNIDNNYVSIHVNLH